MNGNEEPAVGGRGLSRTLANDDAQSSALNRPTPQAPVLPRVAEAVARDALARARLRGLIPEKMAKLEHGRAWEKAEKLRAEVFGDGDAT